MGAVVRGSSETLFAGQGDGLTLGLRPEHIRLADNGVPGTVTSCEYHGADTILTVKVGDETFFVREPGEHPEAVGTTVRLAWKPEMQHVFDNQGRRSCV